MSFPGNLTPPCLPSLLNEGHWLPIGGSPTQDRDAGYACQALPRFLRMTIISCSAVETSDALTRSPIHCRLLTADGFEATHLDSRLSQPKRTSALLYSCLPGRLRHNQDSIVTLTPEGLAPLGKAPRGRCLNGIPTDIQRSSRPVPFIVFLALPPACRHTLAPCRSARDTPQETLPRNVENLETSLARVFTRASQAPTVTGLLVCLPMKRNSRGPLKRHHTTDTSH